MSRLIDADALTEDFKRYLGTLNPDRDGKQCAIIHWVIGVLEIAQPIEPERKTGKWITVPDWVWDEHYKCSKCGAEFALFEGTPKDNDYLFCPHCGSRNVMEEAANRNKM